MIIGKNIKATIIEKISVESIVVGKDFIKAHILPESIKFKGKNIAIVVKFQANMDFRYVLRENAIASYLFNHLLRASSIHSIIIIRLSTIIHKVRTREKLTILLKVYQIEYKYINVRR